MYTVRHYWVRLRWSKRRPYSIARRLIVLALPVVVAAVVLIFLVRR
jgi:hypothetical protein